MRSKKVNRRIGCVLHPLSRVVRRDVGRLGIDDRALTCHGDRLRDRGHLHDHVPLGGASDDHAKPFFVVGAEARHGDIHGVETRRKAGETKDAGLGGDRFARTADEGGRSNRDGCARENSSRLVAHRTEESTRDGLRFRCEATQDEQAQERQRQSCLALHEHLAVRLRTPTFSALQNKLMSRGEVAKNMPRRGRNGSH